MRALGLIQRFLSFYEVAKSLEFCFRTKKTKPKDYAKSYDEIGIASLLQHYL